MLHRDDPTIYPASVLELWYGTAISSGALG